MGRNLRAPRPGPRREVRNHGDPVCHPVLANARAAHDGAAAMAAELPAARAGGQRRKFGLPFRMKLAQSSNARFRFIAIARQAGSSAATRCVDLTIQERRNTMSYRKLLGAAALSLFASMSTAAPYPERELSGVIMWGAGGATDVVARAVTPPRRGGAGQEDRAGEQVRRHRRDLDQLRQQRALRRLHAALRRREPAVAPGARHRRFRLREVLSRQRARTRHRRHRREERRAVEFGQGLRRGREEAPGQAQDGFHRAWRAAAHGWLDAELDHQVPGHRGALRRRRPRPHGADGRARRHDAGGRGRSDREHQGGTGEGARGRSTPSRSRSRGCPASLRSPRTTRSSASICRGGRSTACGSSGIRPTTSRRRW